VCVESSHVKIDPYCPKKKKAQSSKKPKQKTKVAKIGKKSKKKKLKCIHCGWLNHDANHCFYFTSKEDTSLKERKSFRSQNCKALEELQCCTFTWPSYQSQVDFPS